MKATSSATTKSTSPPKGGLRRKLISQFQRPHGWLGHLAGFILANRKSNRERNAWTVELLAIECRDRVLELGYGPGVSIAAASRLAYQGLVAGIDHSEAMFQMASRRNADAILEGRVRLFEAPLDDLPAQSEGCDLPFDQPFDKVLAINALQFVEDPLAVLRAIRSCMRSGGLIAITQQSRKSNATDRDSIEAAERIARMLEEAGFVSTRIETLPLEPVCAACVLATAD